MTMTPPTPTPRSLIAARMSLLQHYYYCCYSYRERAGQGCADAGHVAVVTIAIITIIVVLSQQQQQQPAGTRLILAPLEAQIEKASLGAQEPRGGLLNLLLDQHFNILNNERVGSGHLEDTNDSSAIGARAFTFEARAPGRLWTPVYKAPLCIDGINHISSRIRYAAATDLGSRGAPASVPTEVSCNAENGVIGSWLHETRLVSRRTRRVVFLATACHFQRIPIELKQQGRVHFFRTSMLTATTTDQTIDLIDYSQTVLARYSSAPQSSSVNTLCNVNWEIEKERHEFLRRLGSLTLVWTGKHLNLRDFFHREEINRLLCDIVTPVTFINLNSDRSYSARCIMKFVVNTGYKDEPDVDEDGKPSPQPHRCISWLVTGAISRWIRLVNSSKSTTDSTTSSRNSSSSARIPTKSCRERPIRLCTCPRVTFTRE
ncbi:unnamed protein product [Trichogramma brassicae]|uniref:Uncharacterized protein n=1 Tax=Trichogramma brassicae TaxID=86971 RepID=A0A6H5HVH8_9HYME|nr:unnamed protein product [Trichogramma brassicae]